MSSDLLSTFPIPLSEPMLQIAKQFSQRQSTPEKSQQVYLNTLAVLAMDFYCQCLEIETKIPESDSWNVVQQTLLNVADLVISGIGKLECRPLISGGDTCHVPPEVWDDRIGFVAVEINLEQAEALLLGFMPKVTTESVTLSAFHSLEPLLTCLNPQESINPQGSTPPLMKALAQKITHLGQWLQRVIEPEWQMINFGDLMSGSALGMAPQPSMGMVMGTIPVEGDLLLARPRSVREPELSLEGLPGGVACWQPLDLSTPDQSIQVKFTVGIVHLQDTDHKVWVRVRPADNHMHLPPGLKVQILDALQVSVIETQARKTEGVNLNFQATSGEQFSVRISVDGRDEIRPFLI
jgi:hypothetical protein